MRSHSQFSGEVVYAAWNRASLLIGYCVDNGKRLRFSSVFIRHGSGEASLMFPWAQSMRPRVKRSARRSSYLERYLERCLDIICNVRSLLDVC